MTAKLEDIARELGVSISTVSRAISGQGRVGDATRRRVLDAVQRSGYRVNELARSLRTRSVRSLGIIVPDISNSFCAAVIKGAQQRCRQSDYTLIVCNSDEDAAVEADMLEALQCRRVSGLILASVRDAVAPTQAQPDLPIVYIDNIPSRGEDCDSVSIDNLAAAKALTQAMLDRGHTAIGMITGPLSQSTGRMRQQGFEQALRENKKTPRREWLLSGAFSMESGFSLMSRILALPERPSAMIFANNYIAYGALKALRLAGLRVPEDMAIAAFDARDDTGLITPLITSMNQPAQSIGERAVDILLRRMESPAGDGIRVTLEPEFVDGASW